jgi:hypothetical protein
LMYANPVRCDVEIANIDCEVRHTPGVGDE